MSTKLTPQLGAEPAADTIQSNLTNHTKRPVRSKLGRQGAVLEGNGRSAPQSATSRAFRGPPELERLMMRDIVQHAPAATSRRAARSRASPRKSDDYVRAAEVRALFAGSLAARQQRLAAADMISTDEAAELVNTTRVTINAWIAKGRAVGLTQSKRGFRMPRWQFEPLMWDALPRLSAALASTEGWALLSFLETPHGALDGRSPRQAIEQDGVDRVVAIAGHEES